MIKALKIGLLLLFLSSCGQRSRPDSGSATVQDSLKVVINHYTTKTDIMITDDLKLDKRFERFDQARFDQRSDKKFSVLREYLPDGTYIEMSGNDSEQNHYEIIPPNSYFSLLKIYYANGNIREKGWAFLNYFPSGIWYEFSEEGEFVREVDYDAPFKFTFDDILMFCKDNNIEVAKGHARVSTGSRTSISREVEGDKGWWWIEHHFPSTPEVEVIKLDGKTGKIVKRETSPFEI